MFIPCGWVHRGSTGVAPDASCWHRRTRQGSTESMRAAPAHMTTASMQDGAAAGRDARPGGCGRRSGSCLPAPGPGWRRLGGAPNAAHPGSQKCHLTGATGSWRLTVYVVSCLHKAFTDWTCTRNRWCWAGWRRCWRRHCRVCRRARRPRSPALQRALPCAPASPCCRYPQPGRPATRCPFALARAALLLPQPSALPARPSAHACCMLGATIAAVPLQAHAVCAMYANSCDDEASRGAIRKAQQPMERCVLLAPQSSRAVL